MNDPLIPTGDLAKLAGITERHARRLSGDGALPKITDGKLPLVASLTAYIQHLKTNSDTPDLAAERLRKTKEEADKLALENEKTRGGLVEIEAVYKHFEGLFIALRARILGSGLTDDEKDELLNDLRKLKAGDFSKPVRDSNDSRPAAGNSDATAPAERARVGG